MSGAEHPKPFPYRAVAFMLTCAALAFGVAVAAGVLEVRRPVAPVAVPTPTEPAPAEPAAPAQVPKPSVQRVKAAEDLGGAMWVYRFAGGFPKCWVEVESEGHKRTVGPWVPAEYPAFAGDPLDRPLSLDGYVALFRPTAKEQPYRLLGAVTKVKYRDNPDRQHEVRGFRMTLEGKLPALLPGPGLPKDGSPVLSGSSTMQDGEDPRPVPTGEDLEINFLRADTPATKSGLHIRLRMRFLPPEEVAAVKK